MYGLWLAVTTAAPPALRSMTVQEATWVGDARSKSRLGRPLPASTLATSAAKASEPNRQS